VSQFITLPNVFENVVVRAGKIASCVVVIGIKRLSFFFSFSPLYPVDRSQTKFRLVNPDVQLTDPMVASPYVDTSDKLSPVIIAAVMVATFMAKTKLIGRSQGLVFSCIKISPHRTFTL